MHMGQILASTHSSNNILFQNALDKGRKNRFKAMLTGRRNKLLGVDAIVEDKQVVGRHYAGLQDIPINQIQGSESRNEDFDRNFNPTRTHNISRWHNIASARLHGTRLPAVDLIQLGDMYVVRDGHHRISVAKALGEEYIQAKVTHWELEE
jgi:hypothetical protein